MSKWLKVDTGAIIDTSVSGISENGAYFLLRNDMDRARNFVFGVMVKAVGHTASVQLFSDVLGVRTNLGSPLVPTFGSPAADPEETSLTGERGILVTDIVGTIYPEALQ